MSVSNESEKAEAAPTTPQHELTLRIQLLDYLFERGHRITKPLIDAAAHFAYSYGTALYEQGKLKGQHRGNDLTTEDSTPTRSDLESPLSAPTNTDELEEIMVDFAKLVIEYGRKSDLKPYLEGFDTAKAAIRRLIALKQREVLETVVDMDESATYELNGKKMTGLAIPRFKIKTLIAELNKIIEGEK